MKADRDQNDFTGSKGHEAVRRSSRQPSKLARSAASPMHATQHHPPMYPTRSQRGSFAQTESEKRLPEALIWLSAVISALKSIVFIRFQPLFIISKVGSMWSVVTSMNTLGTCGRSLAPARNPRPALLKLALPLKPQAELRLARIAQTALHGSIEIK